MKKNWRNSEMRVIGFLLLFMTLACSKNKMTIPTEEVKSTEELEQLVNSPNKVVVSSVKTTKAEFESLPITIEVQGIVTYDSRYVSSIPTRISGRLEKVYLKYVFQSVAKGQKVADIYSPELLTAQRELVYLVEHDRDNLSLVEAAKDKLYLLGASNEQVENIIKNKEVAYTFPILSSQSGYVISENQSSPAMTGSSSVPSTGGNSMESMGMSSTAASGPQKVNDQSLGELVREGSYVTAGQALFKVVNPTALRIELNLPIPQAGLIKLGDAVMLDIDKNLTRAHVDFVQPFFSNDEEFIKVRLYLSNSDRLRIGQLVQAEVQTEAAEALWLPQQAVLNLGLERIVFVKDQNTFKPKKVVTGIQTSGRIEITQGLSPANEVAINAQYLVDSESFVKLK
jgi:multidrug efflux pump subunit AcrA (membrane-fusion protein)